MWAKFQLTDIICGLSVILTGSGEQGHASSNCFVVFENWMQSVCLNLCSILEESEVLDVIMMKIKSFFFLAPLQADVVIHPTTRFAV